MLAVKSTALRWIGPLVCAGIALWAGRAVLDVVTSSAGVVRVALLPPVAWLVAAVVVMASAGFGFARLRRDPDVALPLCALLVLALPYLPWLPDQLPVLRIGAGPGRDVLWFVVLSLIVARALSGRRIADARRGAFIVFVVSALLFGAAAWRLVGNKVVPTGDEPHYLVITQSLIRDKDLRIENNHQRGDYREYFAATLRPDYLTRGLDGQIYSVHPIGLAVLSIPAFAIGGYPGVIAMLVLMAALATALAWQWTRDLSGEGAATFAWAAVALTAPFVLNSFTVFPEIPAALAVMIALAWRPSSSHVWVFVARGVAIAALPWLSTKYLPMAAVIGLVWIYRLRFKIGRDALALAGPVAVSLTSWFAFFYMYWGTFSPSAPYGSQEPMTLRNLAHGFPGLLFDQEYGVMSVAPVLVLALAGLVRMWRNGNDARSRAVELAAVFGALIVTVGAFHVWWGGTSSPGRPVVAALLLFAAPVAAFYASASRRSRVAGQVLLALSLAVALVIVFAQNGTLLRNERDGSAAILEWISPTSPIAQAFPSFIVGGLAAASARAIAWLALGAALLGLARLRRPVGEGAFALGVVATGLAGSVCLISIFATTTAMDVEARSRIPLLDSFDRSRRPIGLVFDPLSRVTPEEVLSRTSFVARDGQRTVAQPANLLWKARLALPAGEYAAELTRRAGDVSSLSLQIGRAGPPLESWTVSGAISEQRFTLPVDVSFVGFVAPPEIANSGGALRVRPIRVVDAAERPKRPPVLNAYRYGPLSAFFHTDHVAGEPGGFWTLGGGVAQVTFSANAPVSALAFDLRCGPIANRVTLVAEGWREELEIAAGATKTATVPMRALAATPGINLAALDIAVADAFVPAETDQGSTDRRRLGCWVDNPRAAAVK
jgi:hypothetical protein